ncbi:gamma-glutamyl-phosphate reductase, partial [Glutamicibacter halophytocola]|nr:gamma-glutamyl-phosphate reductase [Glutamicibacter halophytocola]
MDAARTEEQITDVTSSVNQLADRARRASRVLKRANRDWKDRALLAMAAGIDANRSKIFQENKKDLEAGRANGTSTAMLDRLKLDDSRIDGLIAALHEL